MNKLIKHNRNSLNDVFKVIMLTASTIICVSSITVVAEAWASQPDERHHPPRESFYDSDDSKNENFTVFDGIKATYDNQAGIPEYKYSKLRYLPGQPSFTGFENFTAAELRNMPLADLRDFARIRRNLIRDASNIFPDAYALIKETYYRAYKDFENGDEGIARNEFISVIHSCNKYLKNLPARTMADEQADMRAQAAEMLRAIDSEAMLRFFPDQLNRGNRLFNEIDRLYDTARLALDRRDFDVVTRGERNRYIENRLVKLRDEVMPYARTANKAEKLEQLINTLFVSIDYWRARGLRDEDPKEFWRRHDTALRLRAAWEKINDSILRPSHYAELCSLYDQTTTILSHLNNKGTYYLEDLKKSSY